MTIKCNVVAIVVTCKPEFTALGKTLTVLIPQVDAVVVVDNGSELAQFKNYREHFKNIDELIELGDNYGIAYAQNVGIQWARARGATHVLLMDQDSRPASNMVKALHAALVKLELQGGRPACVGPMYKDLRLNRISPFVRLHRFRFTLIPCSSESEIIPVEFLISSGCLIPMSVLDRVGDMPTEMFIDYVDVAWGKRAKHIGFQCYGVCEAKMEHRLGGSPIHILGYAVPTHSPIRSYYRFRNAIYLIKQPWTNFEWLVADSKRLILQYIVFSLLLAPRFQHFKMMSLGFLHGMIGRSGKLK